MSDLLSKKICLCTAKKFQANKCRTDCPYLSGIKIKNKSNEEERSDKPAHHGRCPRLGWGRPASGHDSSADCREDVGKNDFTPIKQEVESMSVLKKVEKRAKYDGRVQYVAVRPEVERMLEQGHRVKAIFEEMSRSGRITISYSTFCDYVRGGGQRFRKSEQRNKNPKWPSRPQGQAGAAGRRIATPDGPFFYDKEIDISELA